MDKLKRQIQQRLIANILIEKCSRSEYLIFRDAWCTQERVIRFTTRFFRGLFPVDKEAGGRWKTGDAAMYEVKNLTDALTVCCVMDRAAAPAAAREALLKALGKRAAEGEDAVILASWDLSAAGGDVNTLFDAFDRLIEKEIPRFESDLREKTEKGEADAQRPDDLLEGAVTDATLNRYERNPKARAACIAAHGTACAVCGIDFGEAYGPEFAGKIEVHHIVPLSEIGAEYVVDPVKDLVPVCPNCHTALHSKPGGVYTVEELKAIKARRRV